MIKKSVLIILTLFLLSPAFAFCGWQEKAALWTYFDALSKSDTKQIDKLLSPDFEYHYYKKNKLVKLDRDNRLAQWNLQTAFEVLAWLKDHAPAKAKGN